MLTTILIILAIVLAVLSLFDVPRSDKLLAVAVLSLGVAMLLGRGLLL